MSEIQVDDLNKGVNAGYGFTLNENVQADFRDVSTPSLLTALMEVPFNDHPFHTFESDKQTKTVALPEVKSRTENGNEQTADGAAIIAFATGSFGTGLKVQTQDWFARRKVGGNVGEKMTESDAVAEKLEKIQTGWDLHTEMGIATLMVSDTNLLAVGGGSNIHPSYNFSTVINGAARVNEAVDFAGAADDIANRFTMAGKRKELQEQLSKLGMSANGYVCICGDEFFRARFNSEAQLDIGRELRSVIDLATSPIPEYRVGGFIYDNFMGSDGIWYINYGSEIFSGTPLVAPKKGYLMPRISGLFSVEFSPSMRRGFAGSTAQPMYAFAKESDYGISMYTESNRLYFNRYPQLVKELTIP
jgi:hypothetical protein